jgi:hypothetical protein
VPGLDRTPSARPTCAARGSPGRAPGPGQHGPLPGSALGVTLAALLAPSAAGPAELLRGFDATVLGGAAVSAAGAALVALLRGPHTAVK